jgi:hypothetical protein
MKFKPFSAMRAALCFGKLTRITYYKQSELSVPVVMVGVPHEFNDMPPFFFPSECRDEVYPRCIQDVAPLTATLGIAVVYDHPTSPIAGYTIHLKLIKSMEVL